MSTQCAYNKFTLRAASEEGEGTSWSNIGSVVLEIGWDVSGKGYSSSSKVLKDALKIFHSKDMIRSSSDSTYSVALKVAQNTGEPEIILQLSFVARFSLHRMKNAPALVSSSDKAYASIAALKILDLCNFDHFFKAICLLASFQGPESSRAFRSLKLRQAILCRGQSCV